MLSSPGPGGTKHLVQPMLTQQLLCPIKSRARKESVPRAATTTRALTLLTLTPVTSFLSFAAVRNSIAVNSIASLTTAYSWTTTMAFSAYSFTMSFAFLSKPSALRIPKGFSQFSYFPNQYLASRPQKSLFDHSWFRAVCPSIRLGACPFSKCLTDFWKQTSVHSIGIDISSGILNLAISHFSS